jgi:chromosome segregation ATPase
LFLKKVEIIGFKSFAQKTVLEFLPTCSFNAETGEKGSCGITAIVGPNGSGKSNVADAIRWAMGEQSMKNLRGKKSEDIIFAGSGKKARLGTAMVTLYFDNSDQRIPLEFSEVAIARRLYRSGESEYLINGSRTRLIDVIDLLAKAGVGKESYCVINQGMSDAVLNATPNERKVIIEDAAGVKQYQIKKERSLKKLETTGVNLQRVGDLIREIEPHLKMLKRQADRAEKGKGLFSELKEKQTKLFSYLWFSFQKEREEFNIEKDNCGIQMMNVQREVDKINDALNQESKEMDNSTDEDQLSEKRRTINAEINNLERELIISEGRMEIEKERLAGLKTVESLPVDLPYVQNKLNHLKKSQDELVERITNIETLDELQEVKEFARAIQQAIADLGNDVGKGKIEVPKENPERKSIEDKIKMLMEANSNIRKKIESFRSEEKIITQKINEAVARSRDVRARFFELEKKLHEKQSELEKLKDNFNEAKIRMARVEVREEDLMNGIKTELKTEPKNLAPANESVDAGALEEEIRKIKFKLEQVGGIDPLVVEEYEETKKRHEFLTTELADLMKAIESLKGVVEEMNQKIEEKFNEAFEEINKEFTEYFKIIFGGGNAHLIKSKAKISKRKAQMEEENLSNEMPPGGSDEVAISQGEEKNEIGVDIFACPPGKKITNLSMLSGGERSLTSIALLFAIIAYNPPPFAILDEVEAALDEANSRRFGRILQELSNNTQFVIISHNRETMRQASLLYGVTMGDDGVSKLLSVKLDQVGNNGNIVS